MRYRHGLQLTASLAFLFVGCAQAKEQLPLFAIRDVDVFYDVKSNAGTGRGPACTIRALGAGSTTTANSIERLRSTLQRIDGYLVRWARRKYKRLRERPKGTRDWLARVRRANPNLFAHWRFVNVGGRTPEAVCIEKFTHGFRSTWR